MPDRVYSTVDEMISDMQSSGHGVKVNEATMFADIRAASDWIDKTIGMFIPRTEARRFDGNGKASIQVDPLLAVTLLTEDGTTLTEDTDFVLYPRNRQIENGCYFSIEVDLDSSSFSVWPKDQNSISITGRWGLYEEAIDTGLDLTLDDSQTSIAAADGVTDGSKLSPGMVLKVESEQILVTETDATALTDTAANLNGAVVADDDNITLTDGTKVKVGEVLTIDTEEMRVMKINGNVIYVDRPWNGTALAAHDTAKDVYVFRTYNVVRAVNGTTAAAHTAKDANRYIPPWDVSYLARQISTLMRRKADTAFEGKTANVELGEVFYVDEFPTKQVKAVKRNYRTGLGIG